MTAPVFAAALPGVAAAQRLAPALFAEAPAGAQAVPAAAADGLVTRSRTAVASFDLLQAATAAGQAGDRGAVLTLNLFDGVALPAAFERFESDAFGHQSWLGRIVGDATSAVTMTWKGDVLSGSVQTGGDLYRVSTRSGVAVIDQLDPNRFGVELPPVSLPEDAAGRAAAADAPVQPAAGEIVDVYVYYTAAARGAPGGQAQIEALIAQGIADSNAAYAASGMQASVRLVGTSELAGFVEDPANMGTDLSNFRNSAMAQNTRNAFNADLMHLVLGGQSNACGVAYLGPSVNASYGVSSHDCFSQYTFTHEMGHNFGNNHSVEDGINSSPWRPYAYGYKNCPAGFRTVQAYACTSGGAGTRIRQNANPNVLYNGLPTGNANQFDALSQSEAFPLVQGWRAGAVPSLPAAPLNLQATVVGNQLTVTWAAPATGAPIATYVLQAGSGPGLSNIYSGAVGAITAISAAVPNGTYYLRVAAQNAAGIGPATADVVATVGAAAPGAPQNLGAVVAGSLLTVSWQPPVSGGPVSAYALQAGTGPGLANVFSGVLGPVTSIAANVPPGTYYLRVFAQGPGGLGPASNEVAATVACPIPAAPVLTGSKAGNVINLSWTAPAGAAGYILRAGTASGLSNLFAGAVGSTNAISAPVGNGVYFIRVSAGSTCGEGAASNEVVITIP